MEKQRVQRRWSQCRTEAQDGFAHLDTKTWRGEGGGGVEARRVGERPEAILSSIVCLSQ